MSTSNGTGHHPETSGARPVTLVRYRPGITGEAARTVHLVPLPVGDQAGAVTALCGVLLDPEAIEPVTPGQGMPCTVCVLSHITSSPPPLPAATDRTRVDPDPLVAAANYRTWGWPVTLHRNQISLNLDGDTAALIIPTPLATEGTTLLARRRSPAPVLIHPYAPAHHILLAGERYGMTLPWPPGVHQITGTLLLPPTHDPARPPHLGTTTPTGRPATQPRNRHPRRAAHRTEQSPSVTFVIGSIPASPPMVQGVIEGMTGGGASGDHRPAYW